MNVLTETQEQVIVVGYCKLWGVEVVHIPNEGKRTLVTGRNLVRLGLRSGFPDLFFPYAKKGYHGLFIEMKRKKGSKVSPAQKEWVTTLNNQGYLAVICYGAEEAINVIDGYFERHLSKNIARRNQEET